MAQMHISESYCYCLWGKVANAAVCSLFKWLSTAMLQGQICQKIIFFSHLPRRKPQARLDRFPLLCFIVGAHLVISLCILRGEKYKNKRHWLYRQKAPRANEGSKNNLLFIFQQRKNAPFHLRSCFHVVCPVSWPSGAWRQVPRMASGHPVLAHPGRLSGRWKPQTFNT